MALGPLSLPIFGSEEALPSAFNSCKSQKAFWYFEQKRHPSFDGMKRQNTSSSFAEQGHFWPLSIIWSKTEGRLLRAIYNLAIFPASVSFSPSSNSK